MSMTLSVDAPTSRAHSCIFYVCRLCHTGALGDKKHMLLECLALADLREEFSPLVA